MKRKAPSSTKNSTGERDPEMHQARKGNQWHFGSKAHNGVDGKEGEAHSVCTSAASVVHSHMLADLFHGAERKVRGDAEYQGQGEDALALQNQTPARGFPRCSFK